VAAAKLSVGLACAAAFALAAPAAAPAATRSAESLLIVDCLLPGKVQRLGTQATYVTARRAMKTTAGDCGVRGGEYTAFDRATAAASMNVWLPAARAGDPEAQTNVGEILEKGVGGQPQPDLALSWYQLAAEQGYPRAQINLGSMYERGVGVPRDTARALEWYRRASGLDAANLAFAPSGEIESLRQERDALAAALETERRERGRLQQELDAVRQRLERDRAALGDSEARLDAAMRELTARSAAVDAETRRAAAAGAEQRRTSDVQLAALRRELDAQRQVVAERDAELGRARRSVASLEDQARGLTQQLAAAEARRTAEVAGARADAETARRELADLTRRLAAAEGELGKSLDAMTAQRTEVARLRGELEANRGRADADVGRRAELEARLSARETELALSRERMGKLNAEVARLEKESAALREAAARAEAARVQAAARPPVVRTTQPGVIRPPPDFSFGRYHALIIGNNRYQHLARLETAVADAQAVEDVLRRRYGFKTTLLLNADRYQLLSALNKLREELTPDDNLLIYYAGHGELDRVNSRGYWLPVDAETNSSANWISSVQITDVLNAMTARQVLLVADSCYSGVLTRAAVARLEAGLTDEERLRWLKAMATKRARVVLTSGGVQPVLDGGGGDHSVFAAAFLDALETNEGVLESQRLAQRVVQKVTTSTAGASIDQIPVYAPIRFAGHEAGDFFFVTRN
jgi:predicted  nucleic acid-binding Zn-ribbon protein